MGHGSRKINQPMTIKLRSDPTQNETIVNPNSILIHEIKEVSE